MRGLKLKASCCCIFRRSGVSIYPPFEKLVGDLAGAFSRRINIHHRLVYQVLRRERMVKVIRMWTHLRMSNGSTTRRSLCDALTRGFGVAKWPCCPVISPRSRGAPEPAARLNHRVPATRRRSHTPLGRPGNTGNEITQPPSQASATPFRVAGNKHRVAANKTRVGANTCRVGANTCRVGVNSRRVAVNKFGVDVNKVFVAVTPAELPSTTWVLPPTLRLLPSTGSELTSTSWMLPPTNRVLPPTHLLLRSTGVLLASTHFC